MSPATHQTIKLSKGRHNSPDEGACVMELASMLAGEPFSDHPVSVCPVIGSCLRAYNDWIDDDRRQDLYRYASEVVGTRALQEIQRARADRVTAWAGEAARRRWTRFLLVRGIFALMLWPQPDDLGSRMVQAVARRRRGSHEEVLGLIDELVEMRTRPPVRPPTRTPTGPPARPLAQPGRELSAPAVTSATIAPITAPASTSPG
jgi:hypothetical protein